MHVWHAHVQKKSKTFLEEVVISYQNLRHFHKDGPHEALSGQRLRNSDLEMAG